ncbi:MAG: hypothetical protein GVY29_02080 [Spirochaetes bacterium]|nr:hypothetical protein [Spirochaetota bacterium]
MTSCGFFLGLGEERSDLYIDRVEPLRDSANEVIGVRIVFYNDGGESSSADFAVLFSTDQQISTAADYTIYVGQVSVPADGNKQVDLNGETQIGPYIESHSIEVPNGDYYIGAIVDINDNVEESDETNNEAHSSEIFPFNMGSSSNEVTVRLHDAWDLGDEGVSVAFVAMPAGTEWENASLIGVAESPINSSDGFAEGTLAEYEVDPNTGDGDYTGNPWYAESGVEYHLHVYLERDGDDDYAEGGFMDDVPKAFTMGDGGETIDVYRDELWIGGTVAVSVWDEATIDGAVFAVGSGFSIVDKTAYFSVTDYNSTDPNDMQYGVGSFVVEESFGESGTPDSYGEANFPDGTWLKVWLYVDMDGSGDGGPNAGDVVADFVEVMINGYEGNQTPADFDSTLSWDVN